jgi:hypothetical protein
MDADCIAHVFAETGGPFRVRLLIFAPAKFFSFFGGAKLGGFRPTRSLQVVC